MFTSIGFQKFYSRSWNKNTDCDVLILVEHTVRELESAVVIAESLKKKGKSVAIDSPKWNMNRLPLLYRPKCVLVPWVYSSKEMKVWKHFRNSEGNRSVIINLHHEQITGANSSDFVLPNSESADVYHLCWGTDYYNSIKDHVSSSSRLLFGSPRLELVKKARFKSSEHLIDEYGLGQYRRILYLSNSFHLQKAKEVNYFETRGVSLKEISKSGKANTNAALKSFNLLLEKERDVQVIYRPHPSMIDRELDFKPLNELAEKYPDRFRIIGNYSVHHWISLADSVITFHSTCFAEAYLLKKPFALFRFHEMPPNDEPKIFELVPKLTNQDELENFLRSPKYVTIDGFQKFYVNSEVDSINLLTDFVSKSVNGEILPIHNSPRMGEFLINSFVCLAKFILNVMGEVPIVRGFFLKHPDYRINNLAWMSGSDAYKEEDIEIYKENYK